MSFADEIRATFRRGDSAAVLRLAEAEVTRARAAGEPAGEVEALYALARLALRGEDLPRAEHLAQAALDVALRAGDRELEERPRHVLAAVARLSGDYALARDRYEASIALNRALGRDETVQTELYNLAFVELHLGNVSRARELFARTDTIGNRFQKMAEAAVAAAEGDLARAADALAATEAAFADAGQVPDPDDAAELARIRATVSGEVS
ncbi:tetratricopeptide repeat protein [Symbioplanes lichenis]|uniref:tetratricopeptide repeat protein n=1 Tax=Symbioplanes lichenis TaxID=1629072 RepID=UPI002739E1E5|nr:tetratricopeptide repeat protein [Actinoplanes lichenis]